MTARTHPLEVLLERIPGKSRDYWLRKAQKKEIPHVRIGRSYHVTEDDIEQIIAAGHVTPADPLRSVVTRRKAS